MPGAITNDTIRQNLIQSLAGLKVSENGEKNAKKVSSLQVSTNLGVDLEQVNSVVRSLIYLDDVILKLRIFFIINYPKIFFITIYDWI